MTLHKPSLFLDRLVVQASGKSVYDQEFSEGLNVIFGENASGKSTVLEFIFYVLGGEIPRWKEIALHCDEIFAGVRVNGTPLTLSREVTDARQRPLSIFWGPIDKALESAAEGWEIFPYRRSSAKDSFSQVLFKALEMPEVPADDSSNITMHQVLRLVYQDQMSSPEDMFRPDEFDRELTKETMGELVCGIYDPQLYADQLSLREVDKAFSEAQAELKSLFTAMGPIGDDLNIESVELEIQQAFEEREQVFKKVEALSGTDDDGDIKNGQKELSSLHEEIISIGSDLVALEAQIEGLGFQVAEAQEFISTLNENLEALKQSELTHRELGEIRFSYCPACFAPVQEEDFEDHCPLCKSPIDHAEGHPHQLRMQREIEMQLRESQQIQNERESALASDRSIFARLQARRHQLYQEYRAKRIAPTSDHERKSQQLHERAGWLERQIEVLADRIEIARRVDELSRRKADLNKERSNLADKIEAAKRAQETQRKSAYTLLSDTTRELLNSDLEREDSFISAQHVDFSFGKERINVDGLVRFAASSSVYLKNSFALALLLASLEDKRFRFPRFLMLDGIEDKGMEENRIHHFQDLMHERSKSAKVSHQIIFTAQTLSNKIQEADVVVGRRYTHTDKTLRF